MSDFRRVTDTFWVSPQISLGDLARARAEGFELVVNNRPDDESPDQPSSAEVEAAARTAGLDYLFAPVIGRPGADVVEEVRAAAMGRKTLAFCRSGTRSIVTWALGQTELSPDRAIAAGLAAGYDLSGVVG